MGKSPDVGAQVEEPHSNLGPPGEGVRSQSSPRGHFGGQPGWAVDRTRPEALACGGPSRVYKEVERPGLGCWEAGGRRCTLMRTPPLSRQRGDE